MLGDLAPCSMEERHLDASHDLGTKPPQSCDHRLWAGVGGRVLAEQAGGNAPPACAEAVARRDSVSQAYLCFPRAAGLLELHSFTRKLGILLEDGLKVRQH